jgi:alpha-1,2-mannosyltransferase
MSSPSPTWTRLLALLALLFATLTTFNAINKGGDAAVFFEGGRRLLHAEPLYAGSSAAAGFIGPPFQAMFFAPFALIAAASPLAAKMLWHALNLACFGLGVWLSLKALDVARDRARQPQAPWLPMLFAPLAAILLPALTNFEHQNMNALLLALIAAATWQMTLGSAAAAGILVGTATALKMFPAFLVLYFVIRRYWTAALAAIVTTIVLSVAPLAIYGAGFTDLVNTFRRLGSSGWPIRGNNQSLIAALDRLTLEFVPTPVDAAGVREAADAPPALALFAVLALLLVGAFVLTIARTPRRPSSIPCEMAMATILAILLSPIAWDHYWLMMFPAFLVVYVASQERRGSALHYAFWSAALLTTGLSPVIVGRSGFNLAREGSAYTVAAIILYACLLATCERLSKAESG